MTGARSIAPTDLRDYLKTCGWSVVDAALRDRLYVLQNAEHPCRQLVFPMDTMTPDYRESVSLVVAKLAELTGQSPDILAEKIWSMKDDVLRLRVSFDGNDSALPLGFAGVLLQNTEKLLKAAACTVLRPRTHHPRLSLSEATQFIEKSRFQQTEAGSFVLKVACPVQALEVQGSLELYKDEAPFVRQVTLALQKSLARLTGAIETDTLDSLVDELKVAEAPLISSNLCEAIAGMHDEQVDNSLDVSFNWSVLHSVPTRDALVPVRVQRDYFARIEEVRRELRSVEKQEEDTFIGTVERLDGVMDDDGRRSGDVILALMLRDEGETVRARITLSADDYDKAIDAHKKRGAYVMVTGRLRPGRQPRQLANATRFELLPV